MEDYTVKSVEKALQLLEAVSEYPQGVAITELAERMRMVKSTVHRLLQTMMRRGFIEQDSTTGRYKLGYAVLDLGMRLYASIDLRKEAEPFLRELVQQTGEVVHLALVDQGSVVYIDKYDSASTIRMHSRVGKRVPVHATGLGKAILAFSPRQIALSILDRYGMPSLTPYTITSKEVFMQILQQVRENGFAEDAEENELGVCCVAAPIFNNQRQAVAACSVSGPKDRMDDKRRQEYAEYVRQAGRNISMRLGYGLSGSSI